MTKPTVGWREWVGLPDLGIPRIAAKIDTGAKSSSIDVSNIEVVQGYAQTRVRFDIRLGRNLTLSAEAPVIDVRTVRNPGRGGREEDRYVIRTDLALGGERWPIDLNLARRTRMTYRMLLGREALVERVMVDPGASYLLKKPRP